MIRRGRQGATQRERLRGARVLTAIVCAAGAAGAWVGCGVTGQAGGVAGPAAPREPASVRTTVDPAGDVPALGRAAIDTMSFPPLEFEPPEPERFTLSNGIEVYYMEDRSLPLVNLFALFRGGSAYFDREDLAAATGVGSSLLLTGGTKRYSPQAVDSIIEYHALGPSLTAAGGSTLATMETLTRHLDLALDLWVEMLLHPRFDPDRVENWRLGELDMVRRAQDQPGTVAVRTFNRVMFGDHPIGWELEPADLTPEMLTEERLRRIHRAVFCADNLTLGIVGDISRAEAAAKLEAAFGQTPACEAPLLRPAPPVIRDEAGVVVIHKAVNQSSVVMGQRGGILQRDDPEYFAAQVANWILGGSGLSSRLSTRVRTQEGLAYSAGTVWGAGIHHERAFGALTQTRADATIAAARVIREVLEEARREPPTEEEVGLAIDNTVNAFVFAFQDPARIVMRQMGYRVAGLPADWLQRYVAGIQRVTPQAVHEVIRRHIRPEDWTIVIVGDTTKLDAPPHTLGPLIER